MKSYAPCKVILFGEHAVVYDKLGIAAAIDQKTFVKVSEGSEGIEITRILEPKYTKATRSQLFGKLDEFNRMYSNKEFSSLKNLSFVDSLLVVIATTMQRYGYKNVKVNISFENMLKGVGRSASKYSAVVLALGNFLGHKIDAQEVSEIAYLGDVVSHGGTPSGIDTSTVTFGGFISYRKSEGIKKLDLDYKLPLVLVDSGEPARTSYTVPMVRRQREEKPEYVNAIFDKIDSISSRGVDALRNKNFNELGSLMLENHSLLKDLGVSTPKLDGIVDSAMKNGALGAKLTAGGGGGCAIILAADEDAATKIKTQFDASGFRAFNSSIGAHGASLY